MTLFWGIVFVALGFGGRFFVGQRRFKRTNEAGIQEHASYAAALTTSAVERVAVILSTLSILLGVLMALSFFIKK